jgi:hypothetical protein
MGLVVIVHYHIIPNAKSVPRFKNTRRYARCVEPLVGIVKRRPLSTLTDMPHQRTLVDRGFKHVDLGCAATDIRAIGALRARMVLALARARAESLAGEIG